MGNEQNQLQMEKYKECLMHVNNDLGMLLQNAENLAYKLGVIKSSDFHYKDYDYYNQFEQKDLATLRKNIVSSIKFLKAQFIAIKQETGKEYMFPPSIENIKKDIKFLKKQIKLKSPNDVKYYKAILSILEDRKFIKIDYKEDDNLNNINKKSDVNPAMWMNMAPSILNHIDKNVENFQMNEEQDKLPDINRDVIKNNNESLIKSNKINEKNKEINNLLKECKDLNYIKDQINKFEEMYGRDPYIEECNENLYYQIMNDISEYR